MLLFENGLFLATATTFHLVNDDIIIIIVIQFHTLKTHLVHQQKP